MELQDLAWCLMIGGMSLIPDIISSSPSALVVSEVIEWVTKSKPERSISVHTEAFAKAAKAVGLFTKPKFIVK